MKENIDLFLEYEKQNRLFERHYKDFYFWEYIRVDIIKNIRCLKGDISSCSKENRVSMSRIGVLKHALRILWKNFIFYKNKKCKILITEEPNQYNAEGKFYESMITTGVADHYKEEALLLARFVIKEDKKNFRYPDTYFMVIPALKMSIINKFYRIFGMDKSIKREIRTELDDIVEQIFRITHVQLDIDAICNNAYNAYLTRKVYYTYYLKILSKKNIDAVVEYCYYSFNNMILNEAAKSMGVPTIELQHGAMGPKHPAYNFLSNENINTFPDFIFVYSDFWKECTRFPLDNSHAIVTGSCDYDLKIKKYPKIKKTEKLEILFIGQTNEFIFEAALKTCEYIKKHNLIQYSVCFRKHPREKVNYYEKYAETNKYLDILTIVSCDEEDVYYSLSRACAVVSMASTVLYESVAYDLPIYIIKSENTEAVWPLVEKGYAKILGTVDELFENTERNMNVDPRYFFMPNAVENVIREIEHIRHNRS